MSRFSIQDVASEMSDKYGLSKNDAETFIFSFFDLINEGLRQDKMVKIKGLGTFKIVDVKERESVNINTGERVIIESHGKITFVPDSIMRDLVNKPFAQFETVVLNEGVDIEKLNFIQSSDSANENIPVDEDAIIEDEITDTPVDDTEKDVSAYPAVINVDEKLTDEEEETAHVSDDTITHDFKAEAEKAIQKIDIEERSVVTSVINEEDSHIKDEDNNMKEECSSTRFHSTLWLIVLVCALVGGVALTVGYYWGHNTDNVIQETVKKSFPVNQIKSMKRAMPVKPLSDTIKVKSKNTTIKPDFTKDFEVVFKEVQDNKQSIHESRILRNAEAKVRTGAYHIIGTSQTVTVKKGENLKRLSKFYLGDGMECYIQVHNGIAEIKEGMKINIPKLKIKKK